MELTFPEKLNEVELTFMSFQTSDPSWMNISLASRYQTHSITMNGGDSLKQIHKGDVEKVPIFVGTKGVKASLLWL